MSLTGSENCEVNSKNTLDVNISGSGNLYYKGKQKITLKVPGSEGIKNAD